MEAKYVGRRTVIQQGAKRAATPATNAAINDALNSNSMLLNQPSKISFLNAAHPKNLERY